MTYTPVNEEAMYFVFEEKYEGVQPAYFNPSDFPWTKELKANAEIILSEVSSLINGSEEMLPNINPPYLSDPNAWRNFYFMNFRWYNHKNCITYPKTYSILKTIPNLSFAGITVLEPGGKVLPHIGETNTTIRCHFGLKIPGEYLDCGISVNGEERGLLEKDIIMFSDAHFHFTWNNTNERRFVLIIDVIQDQFANRANWVCANSLAALTIKYFYEKVNAIKHTPRFLMNSLLFCLAIGWFLYLPIQKQFQTFYK